MIEIIRLDECASTNTYLSNLKLEHDAVVVARTQTAGRGQRGNSWEAEPGMNLTCSLLLHNDREILPKNQFLISEAVSLGIVDTLIKFLPQSEEVSIKWPNDIYVGDNKICGILIEHTISGKMIDRSIIGIGLNINQRIFRSDAPNPISIFNLTGTEIPVEDVLNEMIGNIYARLDLPSAKIHEDYTLKLWRRYLNHYIESASGDEFDASIQDVMPDGTLFLLDRAGKSRQYIFKEVSVILKHNKP